jgi:hypothetical protein
MLITLTPIMFDFRRVFGIGYYDTDNNYFNSYSDGTAGINLHLKFERLVDERYVINTFIETISTGDVVNYGLSSIIIYYVNDDAPVNAESSQFGTPRNNYSVYRFFLNLLKDNNFTCYGTIEMSLETGGVPINDTVNFQLTFVIPLGIEDYMNLDLMIYVLFFFHFFLYIIIPVVLIWIFKPAFGLTLSEEDLKRDELFMKYLRNQANEKRKESEN